jgi:NAD(P)-dependent dehydrogenase (short-subunit alcohol dehydrogenase family)
MKKQKSGSIIITSSVAGITAEPIVGYGYVTAKAGLDNMVRQAAMELAPYNVRVNAIAPGPFFTNIGGGRLKTEPARAKMFADGVPMGRLAHTNEIKGLGLLLASPAGSYITGTVIPVDGGSTAVLPGRFKPRES